VDNEALDCMSRLRISSVLLVVGCASGADDVSGSFTVTHGVPQTTASSTNGGDATSDGSSTGEHDEHGESTGSVSTTGIPPTTTTTHDTSDDDPTGETTDGPMEVNVQNHTGVCGGIIWCTDDNGGVGPHAFAECFDNVGVAPPFDVVEVRYAIGAKELDPSSFKVEVRNWSNNAPGTVIGSQNLTAADISVGVHGIVLQNPIRVNASSFCVALEANEAFGVRRDESNPVPGRAFVRADQCNIIDYVSLATLQNGEFAANFCMSAKVLPVE
jgi:hypothetical protein